MKNQFTSILLILSVIAIVLSGCGNLSSGTAGNGPRGRS